MRALEPIRLGREAHRALAGLAAGFATATHIAYVTEALVAARSAPDDPLASLEVLASMQGTAYAGRKGQAPALSAVGRWLEANLATHLDRVADGAPAGRVAEVVITELGWLRRLAMARAAVDRQAKRARPAVGPDRPFGRSLGLLRARWQGLVEPGRDVHVSVDDPSEPPPSRPEPVTAWRAGFADFLKAREVWKVARKRIDQGKPAKDKRIPLAIRAPEPPAGATFEASFTLTAGLVELWRAVDAAGGQARDFQVVEWDEAQTPWLATRVEFEP